MQARGFLTVLLVAGGMAAGCASSSATPAYKDYPIQGEAATAAPAASAAFNDGGAAFAGPTAAATSGPAVQPGQNPTVGGPASTANAARPEDQIIKIGSISIQVGNLDDSIARATDQIHAIGGLLAGSDRTVTSAEDLASVTYRLPVAQFETALSVMRKLGTKVLSEHTESTQVGGQIVDLTARIANLRASEKAIQAIMAKANTIGDVLTVQQRLADVQGQIEELSGQLNGLTDQAAFSTLTVIFEVPILSTPSPSPSPTPSPVPTATPIPWSAGDQAGQATGALSEVGKSTATILIWIVILVLPIILVLLLLLVLLGGAARIVDPFRKRLLPFTVARPATFAQPWYSQPPAPVPGQPIAGNQATPTQPPPKP
jgi:hypothetical protein